MKRLFFFILFFSNLAKAQIYFPPNSSNIWDTISPSKLGWCENKIDSLYNFLDENNSKAFILLKDGKIVLEKYFGTHTQNSIWHWASAGKSLTALLIGIAQEENFLKISDTSSKYLGVGWTNCTIEQENKITIRHQLTMTTGLEDLNDCTLDTCFNFLALAGTRWAYHTAPYTILDSVIENATKQKLNNYLAKKIKNITGMDGLFVKQGYYNVFYSTARSMARFGLLILNRGVWDGNNILTDANYFNDMLNSSQNLNLSYGYLWWLNGKNSFMAPNSQYIFSGSIHPNAPNDMISAIGKNGQFINIIPSQNLVWIRIGNSPDDFSVPYNFNDKIAKYIKELDCNGLSVKDEKINGVRFSIYPNPTNNYLLIQSNDLFDRENYFYFYNILGELLYKGKFFGSNYKLSLEKYPKGIYFISIKNEFLNETIKIVKR